MSGKTVLITGASGYVGNALIKHLMLNTGYSVFALCSSKDKLQHMLSELGCENRITFFDRALLDSQEVPWNKVDILIHLAFARKQIPQSELVESMIFGSKIFRLACENHVSAIINISSQSIYGSSPGLHNENSFPCPLDFYAMAKAANEVILESVCSSFPEINRTNIRLDSIAGNKNLVPSLVRQGVEEKSMKIIGGKQVFSLLDVRDVAAGITALCATDPEKWETAYNLGWHDRTYDLVQMAELVKARLALRGIHGINISLEEKDFVTYAGMDSRKFTKLTGWKPQYTIEDIIDAVIDDYFRNREKDTT